MGDFNIDLLSSTYYSRQLTSIFIENGFKQLIDEPTRITKTSATLIDLVATNYDNILTKVNHVPKITDHAYITIKLQIPDIKLNSVKLSKRSFKNYDERTFQDLLLNSDWNNSIIDTNILAENLTNSIMLCLDQICPVTEIIIPTKYADKKWITVEIIQVMKERDNKYEAARITNNDEDWKTYKEKRNEVTSMIRKQKQKYYERKIDDCKNDTKSMWKTLKQICNKKCHSNSHSIIFNGKSIHNDAEIAENFNKYFIDSISDIITNIPTYNVYEIPKNDIQERFTQFQQIDMRHLKETVFSLPNKVGSDGISTKIIKTSFELIGNRFLDVINNSLQTGIFPNIWKSSVIMPIPKIANTMLSDQHRPINSLPICEKILELIVKEQLKNHCAKNNILISEQSGFRETHSCESALQCIVEDWVKENDNNNVIVAVFLDFKRAFETINRSLLITKLHEIGVDGIVLQWFSSYLCGRRQQTKFGVSVSNEKETEHGVPQGSVLGPILFIIFINDIVKAVPKCKIHLFADDTCYTYQVKMSNRL